MRIRARVAVCYSPAGWGATNRHSLAHTKTNATARAEYIQLLKSKEKKSEL